MINESFIFLDRISHATEKKIWSQGIHTWDDFMQTRDIVGVAPCRKSIYDMTLSKAKRALNNFDINYFSTLLNNSDAWRLYNHFQDEAVYIDIETTGYYGDMTVLGMYDGYDSYIMVRGKNMDKESFLKYMSNKKLILTFNGASFDLPIIEKYFRVKLDLPHIDLRHVCSKVGLTGGLKKIEKQIGISRDEEVEGVTGLEAVRLWNQYRATGNEDYLSKLVKYNEEDIVNLKPLAKLAIKNLWAQTKPTM